MKKNKISAITSKINSIPTLPTVAMKVIQTTSDPASSAKDLMGIINPDIALTTKILRIANSPFYGFSNEIASLQHAITILGFKEIRNLVISTVIFDSFKNIKKDTKYNVGDFWKHSFISGLAAKIISTDLKKTGNEYFVAGLIHDIGKLVIYIALPDIFAKLIEMTNPLKSKFMSYQIEKNIIGMTHDEIGMMLLKKWMFPKDLMISVGYHHRLREISTESDMPFVVHTADIFAHIHEIQADNEDEDHPGIGTVYRDFIKLSGHYGIKWDTPRLNKFQQELAKSVEKEADILRLFF